MSQLGGLLRYNADSGTYYALSTITCLAAPTLPGLATIMDHSSPPTRVSGARGGEKKKRSRVKRQSCCQCRSPEPLPVAGRTRSLRVGRLKDLPLRCFTVTSWRALLSEHASERASEALARPALRTGYESPTPHHQSQYTQTIPRVGRRLS